MNDQKEEEKIEKLVQKKKSAPIIKLMGKADKETLTACLAGRSQIGDEASINQMTHYFDNEDGDIRLAACKAALVINDSYIQTRVRHSFQLKKTRRSKPVSLKRSML